MANYLLKPVGVYRFNSCDSFLLLTDATAIYAFPVACTIRIIMYHNRIKLKKRKWLFTVSWLQKEGRKEGTDLFTTGYGRGRVGSCVIRALAHPFSHNVPYIVTCFGLTVASLFAVCQSKVFRESGKSVSRLYITWGFVSFSSFTRIRRLFLQYR